MPTVVKIKKKIKFPLVVQGENFAKIKLLEERYDKRRVLLNKSYNKKLTEINEEFWSNIYEIIGQKLTQNITLNSGYVKAGMYILETSKTCLLSGAFTSNNGE